MLGIPALFPSGDFNVELHSTKLVCHFVVKFLQLNTAKLCRVELPSGLVSV